MTDREFLYCVANLLVEECSGKYKDHIDRLRRMAEESTKDDPEDTIIYDLKSEPMTMQQLFMILCSIGNGETVLIKNGAREMGSETMHRLERMHVARHEALVRQAREQERYR